MNNLLTSADYSSSFNKVVFDAVPEKTFCLDVGCWNGNLGRALIQEKGCAVDGLDANGEVLNQAKVGGYSEVFCTNLNNNPPPVIGKKYDVIIFADVLEHLIDPVSVLRSFRDSLKPEGLIIVSLPNVAFLQNRVNLLFGKWDYRDFGILDKTHLKFYTLATGCKMAEDAGYEIKSVFPYNQFNQLKHLKLLVAIFPSLFAYQFLIVAGVK